MNITNEDSSIEQYAIISYSHEDSDIVKSELEEFNNHGVCYWFDERMTGGMGYDTQFCKALDKENCKGIVFFISDTFLLSDPCAEEMRYLKDKYGVENENKFCLFILPKDYPLKDEDKIFEKISQYVEEKKSDAKIQDRAKNLREHIRLFLELNRDGKVNCAKIGNSDNYIGDYCKDGLFYESGIIFGHKGVNYESFGYFPQKQNKMDIDALKIEKDGVLRDLDKKPAYYAPIEWLVIGDNEQKQTLLSKDLLFAVDYLGLKHPFKETRRTLKDRIGDVFNEYFKKDENDKREFENIRFLSEWEFQTLIRRCKEDLKRRREMLLPEATFFAQTSDIKNAPAFWLAGDINDARWVDVATKSLSDQKVGTELYYVRVVVDIKKPANN